VTIEVWSECTAQYSRVGKKYPDDILSHEATGEDLCMEVKQTCGMNVAYVQITFTLHTHTHA